MQRHCKETAGGRSAARFMRMAAWKGEHMKLNIIKNYLTNNRCYKKNEKRRPIGIQLHTIGTGQGTAQAVADYWNQSAVPACVTYIVDCDTEGKVLQCLPEDVRSWADTGYGNNNLITFEICESDYIRYTGGANYDVLDAERFKADIMRGYNTAVLLCADICRRHGWNPTAKLPSGLCLISSHDEGRRAGLSSAHVDPTHVWNRFGLTMDQFRSDVKQAMSGDFEIADPGPERWYRIRKQWEDIGTQLGAYRDIERAKTNCPAGYTVYDWNGKAVYTNTAAGTGTQTAEFVGLSETAAAARLLEICRPIAEKNDLFPSVCAAQTILESGYCTTELARKANNVCGMKTNLSGNTWPGSTWDGKSKVNIRTPEQDAAGNTYYIYADFRVYPCVEESIKDRCAYLLGAKDGSKLRYDGIQDCENYRKQIELIKRGRYASDVDYVDKICSIIERFNLDKYDQAVGEILPETPDQPWYRVRREWFDTKSQIGAYHDLEKAKACADQNAGYSVYDESGKRIYPEKQESKLHPILEQCKKYQAQLQTDLAAGKKWQYRNPSKYIETIWSNALKKNKRACNCALLAVWAVKDAGLMPKNNEKFYGYKGGTIKWSNATRKAIEATCHVIKIGNRTVKQLLTKGNLRPGDIVTYVSFTHTNIYAGNGYWYDAGRIWCDGTNEGANFQKWYGKANYDNQKVGYIIRPKETVSKPDPGTDPDGKQHVVQVGSFMSKANAEKLFRRLKKAGFDALVKKQDGQWKVQCGVFSVRANAEALAKRLKASGFNAIIK